MPRRFTSSSEISTGVNPPGARFFLGPPFTALNRQTPGEQARDNEPEQIFSPPFTRYTTGVFQIPPVIPLRTATKSAEPHGDSGPFFVSPSMPGAPAPDPRRHCLRHPRSLPATAIRPFQIPHFEANPHGVGLLSKLPTLQNEPSKTLPASAIPPFPIPPFQTNPHGTGLLKILPTPQKGPLDPSLPRGFAAFQKNQQPTSGRKSVVVTLFLDPKVAKRHWKLLVTTNLIIFRPLRVRLRRVPRDIAQNISTRLVSHNGSIRRGNDSITPTATTALE